MSRKISWTITGISSQRVRVGCSQVAAKDNAARPLNCLMNADPQAGPWMPRIQQLPKLGTVGVLKFCCTTAIGLIRALSARPIEPTSNCNRGGSRSEGSMPSTDRARTTRTHDSLEKRAPNFGMSGGREVSNRFLAITILLDVKDIPQVGPLQW